MGEAYHGQIVSSVKLMVDSYILVVSLAVCKVVLGYEIGRWLAEVSELGFVYVGDEVGFVDSGLAILKNRNSESVRCTLSTKIFVRKLNCTVMKLEALRNMPPSKLPRGSL